MEDFHKRITYMVVYDRYANNGRDASLLANSNIKEHLLANKKILGYTR